MVCFKQTSYKTPIASWTKRYMHDRIFLNHSMYKIHVGYMSKIIRNYFPGRHVSGPPVLSPSSLVQPGSIVKMHGFPRKWESPQTGHGFPRKPENPQKIAGFPRKTCENPQKMYGFLRKLKEDPDGLPRKTSRIRRKLVHLLKFYGRWKQLRTLQHVTNTWWKFQQIY